jgi:hypothetical protein
MLGRIGIALGYFLLEVIRHHLTREREEKKKSIRKYLKPHNLSIQTRGYCSQHKTENKKTKNKKQKKPNLRITRPLSTTYAERNRHLIDTQDAQVQKVLASLDQPKLVLVDLVIILSLDWVDLVAQVRINELLQRFNDDRIQVLLACSVRTNNGHSTSKDTTKQNKT